MARRSFFYDALLLTGANLLMRGVSMVFQVYLVGRIGAGGIGLLTLINTVGMLAAVLGAAGSRVAATCLVAEEYGFRRIAGVRRAMTACLRYALLSSALVGLLTVRLAGAAAEHWLGDMRTASSIRVLGWTLPLTCLWGVLGGYFTATDRVGRLVAVQFADRLMDIGVTAALLTLWAGADVERGCLSIIGGSAVGTALSVAVLYGMYRRDSRAQPAGSAPPMGRRLLQLALPLSVSDDLRAGLTTVEHFLIPWGLRQYGASGSAAIASYGTIHGMVFPVLMFPSCVLSAVADLLVPELSHRRATGNRARICHVVRQCAHWGLIFSAAVAGVLWLIAAPLSQALYHSDEAGVFLRQFAPLVFLLYMDAIVDGMLKGLLQQVHSARYNTFTSIIDVVFLFVSLPRWGLGGYFWTFTITHAVNFYLSIARLLRVTDYRPDWGFVLRLALSTAAAALAAAQLRGMYAVAGCYLLLLALLLRLTGAVDAAQLRWLAGILRRRAAGQAAAR